MSNFNLDDLDADGAVVQRSLKKDLLLDHEINKESTHFFSINPRVTESLWIVLRFYSTLRDYNDFRVSLGLDPVEN